MQLTCEHGLCFDWIISSYQVGGFVRQNWGQFGWNFVARSFHIFAFIKNGSDMMAAMPNASSSYRDASVVIDYFGTWIHVDRFVVTPDVVKATF